MSGDWQVGDLALCVSAFECGGIHPGQVFRVERVARAPLGYIDAGELGLYFAEIKSGCGDGGWIAYRFIKIRPHEPDAEDLETIELYRRSKVGAHA